MLKYNSVKQPIHIVSVSRENEQEQTMDLVTLYDFIGQNRSIPNSNISSMW